MTDRILDITEAGAVLRVQHSQLVIARRDDDDVSVPIEDLAAIVLANPQVTCTVPALAALMDHGATVVVCNASHTPCGLMLPTAAHFSQTERFAAQASAAKPVSKRLWKQIVQHKVREQACLLEQIRGGDFGLRELAHTVRSGDPRNVEAQAARRYWPALFDDPDFRRRRDADDQNRLLNYGYAVLRATVGRAISAVGLHPSLGLHHHNRYNAFCLADDLMEPYRVLVDQAVIEHVATYGKNAPLDRVARQALLDPFTQRLDSGGESRSLFDHLARTASSLAKVYLQQAEALEYPERMTDVLQ